MSCMVRHVWQLGHSSFPSENTRLTRSSLVPYRSQSRPLKDGCHRWATYPRAERMDQSTALSWDAADAFWDFGLLWHTAANDAGTLGCRPSRWTKLPLQRWFPNCNEGLWQFQAASTVSTVIYSHSDLTMTSTQPPIFAQGTTQATSCQLSTHNGEGQLSHRHLRRYAHSKLSCARQLEFAWGDNW